MALAALIEKLEQATEGSRELGEKCLLACGWTKVQVGYWLGPQYWWAAPDNRSSFNHDHFHRHNPLTSMDAAISLIEPGVEWEVSTIYHIARATVGLNTGDSPGTCYGERKDCNVALALSIAAVKYVKARKEAATDPAPRQAGAESAAAQD